MKIYIIIILVVAPKGAKIHEGMEDLENLAFIFGKLLIKLYFLYKG